MFRFAREGALSADYPVILPAKVTVSPTRPVAQGFPRTPTACVQSPFEVARPLPKIGASIEVSRFGQHIFHSVPKYKRIVKLNVYMLNIRLHFGTDWND